MAPAVTSIVPAISQDQNRILVPISVSSYDVPAADNPILSPSNIPLRGATLFPDTNLETTDKSSLLNRIEKLENQAVDSKEQLSVLTGKVEHLTSQVGSMSEQIAHITNQLAIVISALSSAPGILSSAVLTNAQESDTPLSTQPSETPPISENCSIIQPSPEISKPIAWNGTNSQIKIAASSTKTVAPPKTPSIKVPTTSLQALDPPPRPRVIPAHLGTSALSRACPRRATTSLQLIHNLSRVADGEPTLSLIQDRRPRRSTCSRKFGRN